MSISRIDKMVCEILKADSLQRSSGLRVVDVDIFLGPDQTGKVAQMAITAVALALRSVKGMVRVHLPKVAPSPLSWQRRSLIELLREEAEAFGTPDRLQLNPKETGLWRIGLGTEVVEGITADACGWTAGVNKLFRRSHGCAAPAAVFATCCAFAKLFSTAVLLRSLHWSESWSLNLTDFSTNEDLHGPFPDPGSLGLIRLLGAGAIGSGFAYTLWLSGWQLILDVIDFDYYDEPNHETTMRIGLPEVRRNRKKAVALAENVKRDGLKTKFRVERILKGNTILHEHSDVFVCAVDNAKTRQILDYVNADLLINAGVGGRTEDAGHVVWTRHLTDDPRLSQRYSAIANDHSETTVPKEFREDECSRLAYRDASLAAPFIGLAAGALLAASCGLRAAGRLPTLNYFKIDMLKLQSCFQAEAYQVSSMTA